MNRLKELASAIIKRIKEEPVLVSYAALFVSNIVAYFGFDVDADALASFDALVVPMLAIMTRKRVAPMSKLRTMTPEELVEAVLGEDPR